MPLPPHRIVELARINTEILREKRKNLREALIKHVAVPESDVERVLWQIDDYIDERIRQSRRPPIPRLPDHDRDRVPA